MKTLDLCISREQHAAIKVSVPDSWTLSDAMDALRNSTDAMNDIVDSLNPEDWESDWPEPTGEANPAGADATAVFQFTEEGAS